MSNLSCSSSSSNSWNFAASSSSVSSLSSSSCSSASSSASSSSSNSVKSTMSGEVREEMLKGGFGGTLFDFTIRQIRDMIMDDEASRTNAIWQLLIKKWIEPQFRGLEEVYLSSKNEVQVKRIWSQFLEQRNGISREELFDTIVEERNQIIRTISPQEIPQGALWYFAPKELNEWVNSLSEKKRQIAFYRAFIACDFELMQTTIVLGYLEEESEGLQEKIRKAVYDDLLAVSLAKKESLDEADVLQVYFDLRLKVLDAIMQSCKERIESAKRQIQNGKVEWDHIPQVEWEEEIFERFRAESERLKAELEHAKAESERLDTLERGEDTHHFASTTLASSASSSTLSSFSSVGDSALPSSTNSSSLALAPLAKRDVQPIKFDSPAAYQLKWIWTILCIVILAIVMICAFFEPTNLLRSLLILGILTISGFFLLATLPLKVGFPRTLTKIVWEANAYLKILSGSETKLISAEGVKVPLDFFLSKDGTTLIASHRGEPILQESKKFDQYILFLAQKPTSVTVSGKGRVLIGPDVSMEDFTCDLSGDAMLMLENLALKIHHLRARLQNQAKLLALHPSCEEASMKMKGSTSAYFRAKKLSYQQIEDDATCLNFQNSGSYDSRHVDFYDQHDQTAQSKSDYAHFASIYQSAAKTFFFEE